MTGKIRRRGTVRPASPRRHAPEAVPVAVVGDSAGGLAASRRLLSALPARCGMAFVLIPHLDPAREHPLAGPLAGSSALPVVRAAQGQRLRRDQIYVIPPNRLLRFRGGRFLLSPLPDPRAAPTSLDVALCSLAEDRGRHAIGIVLSGTGNHGVAGLQAIRRAGGLALAQDPATAGQAQMPRRAVAIGAAAGHVMAPEKMPAVLVEHAARLGRGRRRRGGGAPLVAEPADAAELLARQLPDDRAPAAILVNPAYRILAVRGNVARYLKTPASSLLVAAGAGLRSATRRACEQALRTRRPVRNVGAWVRRKGRNVRCTVSARSLERARGGERLLLVTLDEEPAPQPAREQPAGRNPPAKRGLNGRLQVVHSERLASFEDLERANRNIEALNEEAASANERLRASNEELQSANDELHAANQELESWKGTLQERADEIERIEEQLRAVLDATADAVVTTDAGGRIVTFNKSATRMFGYAVDEVIGRPIDMLVPPDADDVRAGRPEASRGAAVRASIGAPREVVPRRRTGSRFPALLSVSETLAGELLVVCLRDLSLDKALQREVLRIATLEQQRIGQELHDGLQQELTGIGLLAQNLADDLARAGSADAPRAARLAAGVAEANLNVRSLARGLVPVPVDAGTLPVALAELAKNTQETCRIACRFDCPEPVELRDAATATHLYRIAQEAVGNAVKHAKARDIRIRLMRHAGGLRLEVCDDGIGVPALAAAHAGVGLRLMEHRCTLIGGRFALESRAGAGTAVSCTIGARSI